MLITIWRITYLYRIFIKKKFEGVIALFDNLIKIRVGGGRDMLFVKNNFKYFVFFSIIIFVTTRMFKGQKSLKIPKGTNRSCNSKKYRKYNCRKKKDRKRGTVIDTILHKKKH